MIGICCDHAGFPWKADIIKHLESKGLEVKDFGTNSAESMDYTDVAHPMAYAIENGELEKGIAFCGTGNGMAMSLNHHQGIIAGLAWNTDIAALIRQHNNSNVLVFPARFISYEEAIAIIDTWLTTPFEGGRHQRRIEKIPVK